MSAPAFRVSEIELFERPVTFRLPFRFGIVTLTRAPQAFVRARIEFPDGVSTWGAAAQLLVPKWFDKNPTRSNDENFAQLRRALVLARDAYADRRARTAFDHFAAHYGELIEAGATAGLPPLAINFGPALVDCAIIDALGRATQTSFPDLLRTNALAIDPERLAPDLAEFSALPFLEALEMPAAIDVRHTVGMVDRLTDADPGEIVGDGLPETLEAVVARYGHRWFKLRVGGNPDSDFARIARIAKVLDRITADDYHVTLDGNEQYPDLAAIGGLLERLGHDPATARLARAIAFVEQPMPRAMTLDVDIAELARRKPVIIDEADEGIDAFVTAKAFGYAGVSSKACKGVYRSVLNAMRCEHWNALSDGPTYFMSGEDLTTQAGLALQQDLALAAVLRVTHVERNGHHYVSGFAGQRAPAREASAFLDAHSDLYEGAADNVRLLIRDGSVALGSLSVPGFATAVHPDFSTMAPMPPLVALA